MRILSATFALCALVAVGCTAGPDVRVDKSPTANLKQYKTFGFYDASAANRAQYSSITAVRLQQATRTQLEKLGYSYDESAPQLRVNIRFNVADRQEIRTSRNFPYHPLLGGPIDTVNYKAGALGIDLVDSSTNSVVWQGVAEGRVSREALQNPGPAVDQVVTEIFQRFHL